MSGYFFSQQQGLSKGLVDALPLVTLRSRTDGVQNMTSMNTPFLCPEG